MNWQFLSFLFVGFILTYLSWWEVHLVSSWWCQLLLSPSGSSVGVDRTTIASKSSAGLQFAGHAHWLDLEGPRNSERGCMTRWTLNQNRNGTLHCTTSRTVEEGRERERERERACEWASMCTYVCTTIHRDLQVGNTIYGESGFSVLTYDVERLPLLWKGFLKREGSL